MFDFKHLQVSSAVAWYDIPEVNPGARLQVRPASDSNHGYYNAVLKRSALRARRLARIDRLTAEDAEQSRQEDLDLYPRFVLVGWENIVDTNGAQVPFSADHAKEFLKALPSWLFDRLRAFCSTPERFVKDPNDLPPDAQELAGNSGSGSSGS